MLKKIFLKLIIILIIFLFPLISFAEESANVSLKCDKDNIKLEEELELEIFEYCSSISLRETL